MVDVDLTQTQAAAATKIVGAAADGTEQMPVRSSANGDLGTSDILDAGGVNKAIALAPNVAQELKVGGTVLANRKYVIFQATDNGVSYGFSSGVTVANGLPIFKNQLLMMPVGPNTQVWFICATAADVRIAEVA